MRVLDVDRVALPPALRTAGAHGRRDFRARSPSGEGFVAVDFGQNIAGWVRVVVRGRAGDTVVVRHAEVLEEDGALHVAALRSARATDTYILDRDGEHVLEPAFTFHGFQYADVTGAEVSRRPGSRSARHAACARRFSSSEPALDKLHENVAWSQRDNFVSVPTDCPQRDERLGWTGDAQAFAATASTLFDSEAFWRSWLVDLEIDQDADGSVAAVVPNIIVDADFDATGDSQIMGRAGWADAATIVPWAVYESTGSDEALVQQLDSMRRWVDHLERRAGAADCCRASSSSATGSTPMRPATGPGRPRSRATSSRTRSSAGARGSSRAPSDSWATPTVLIAPMRLADRVATASWARWGEHAASTQSGCALAIEFAIAPAEQIARARRRARRARPRAERAASRPDSSARRWCFPRSTRTGHLDEAYAMLLRREAPSWLYQVDRGATTVWERWDALRPDGSIHPGR